MATTKRNSRILDELHDTARGLHAAGLICKRPIQQIEKLDAGKKRQVRQMIDTLIEPEQLRRQTADGSTAHANG